MDGKIVVASVTPFEVWALRFNYTPPPAPVKGPSPKVRGVELVGTHPYFGPSKSVRARRGGRVKVYSGMPRAAA